jgi:UDP-Gal:alpha-D-GlcNAc-diphosphoundecaprenol beta-1,4-galactosyltransferase
VKIRDFLLTRHLDVVDWLAKGNISSRCILYINPFNYQIFRNGTLDLTFTSYVVDGIYMSKLIGIIFHNNPNHYVRQSFDMTAIAPAVFDHCIKHGLSIYFAGGSEIEIARFTEIIKSHYPELSICGSSNGYRPEHEIIAGIEALAPDVVILGLGNQKQEVVAITAFARHPAVYFTCGAFISQTANSVRGRYYPPIINKLHLRWLYRFFREPHVIRRVLLYYPLIVWQLIYDRGRS